MERCGGDYLAAGGGGGLHRGGAHHAGTPAGHHPGARGSVCDRDHFGWHTNGCWTVAVQAQVRGNVKSLG